jgi:hypothetical protein
MVGAVVSGCRLCISLSTTPSLGRYPLVYKRLGYCQYCDGLSGRKKARM